MILTGCMSYERHVEMAQKKTDHIAAMAEKAPVLEAEEEPSIPSDVISYNGRLCRYNNSIQTFLIMGIDKETEELSENQEEGGQADAIFLMILDQNGQKISLININRNTMTDVDMYDEKGEYVGTAPLQICLQHGYGDGDTLSCERMQEAVANLLYQIPINGYISVNMDAIPELNDAIGGVTLTTMCDIPAGFGYDAIPGSTELTLTGDQAMWYMRYRNINEFESSVDRSKRQEQYLKALLQQMKPYLKNHTSSIPALANILLEHSTTNIPSNEMISLIGSASEFKSGSFEIYSLEGETIIGETKHEEFYPDENAIYDLIMNIWYEDYSPEKSTTHSEAIATEWACERNLTFTLRVMPSGA